MLGRVSRAVGPTLRRPRCNQSIASTLDFGVFCKRDNEDNEDRAKIMHTRNLHMTHKAEFRSSLPAASTSPFILAFGVAGIAYGGSKVIELYDLHEQQKAAKAKEAGEAGEEAQSETKQGSFTSWFSFGAPRFYEGGFEDEMTKREAALILGIRESSPRKKVREAHRRLSMLNHPDTGKFFVFKKL
mmetsp:Transcript_1219/g.1444  ORF Transcript_1219/g.1444 Transcript_1219/m.1444 type:complete len:186 (-) Transcript_1219:840-1397(-)